MALALNQLANVSRVAFAEVGAYADGVIVGSALVRALVDAPDERAGLAALTAVTQSLAAGVRSARLRSPP